MSSAFVPGLKVSRSAALQKVRELPIPGELLVAVGDQVTADQVVAVATLPGDLIIARIAEKMAIEPFEVLSGLAVKIGDVVQQGQILCRHSGFFGLFKSTFESPVSGTVEFITERTGHLAIRVAPRKMELRAFLAGKVTAIAPGSSVTISSRGALVQGIFGVGGERCGTLRMLAVEADAEIEPQDIPDPARGLVLVGGARPSLAALQLAAARGAVGLVCGAIDDRTLAGYLGYELGIALTGDEQVVTTVIVTEGFGNLAFSQRALAVLREFDGSAVSINGATQVRAGALRPEILVPRIGNAIESQDEAAMLGLELGRAVRIIRVPYFGVSGTVKELPEGLVKIETGADTRVAVIELQDGRQVAVPRANLELI